MIPIGYMAKKVASRPDGLKAVHVEDIYSVSGCISENFCNYIDYWKHNGYWLFDSPQIIKELSAENGIDLSKTTLFYYEAYELQFFEEEPAWEAFYPDTAFSTNVVSPRNKTLMGYDIVSFSAQTAAECSYLSCNYRAEEIEANEHCLLDSLEQAIDLIDKKAFVNCEPGPCRIFAVYRV